MIVDFHVHLFPPEVVANQARFLERDAAFARLYGSRRHNLPALEEAIASMDEAGVDHAVVLGFGWVDPGLCAFHNDFLADAIHRYPARLSAFAAVQPLSGLVAAAEVERAARLGLRGIGELMPHLQGYCLDDEHVVGPVAEAAIANGLPVLTHASEPVGHSYVGKGDVGPRAILSLAERWPDLSIVAAHWGGGLPFYELMPEVAAAARNLYYDTAASPYLYRDEVFRTVTELVGADRVLFGTDYPLLGHRRFLRRLREVGLGDDALRLILGGNASRLLHLT
jgi:predicted TIM-barrel fold metal-dependent hydrolase